MQETIHPQRFQQATLADQFATPSLWRTTLPSEADQLAARKWHDQFYQREPSVAPLIGLDTIPLYNDHFSEDRPAWKQRVRFYSDKIVIYPVALNPRPRMDQPKKCLNNLTRGQFKGFISKGSGLTIRKRLEAWIKAVNINRKNYQGRGKPKHAHIVFATVTLPADQVHGDNEIKRSILMPFIQQLKRLHGVDQYFWSAEPQENDNIHFHLLFDRYVAADRLNDLWNVACNNLGYLNRYVDQTGDTNPPSTRINVCPPDMSLVKYVLKYVSKQPRIQYSYSRLSDRKEFKHSYWEHEEIKGGLSECEARGLEVRLDQLEPDGILYSNKVTYNGSKWFRWYRRRPIEGRSWGMSKSLAKIDIYSSDVSYRVQDIRSVLEWDSSVRFVQKDHCEVFYCNTFDVLLKNDKKLLQAYTDHYLQVYRDLYLPKPKEPPKVVPVISLHNSRSVECQHFRQLRFDI